MPGRRPMTGRLPARRANRPLPGAGSPRAALRSVLVTGVLAVAAIPASICTKDPPPLRPQRCYWSGTPALNPRQMDRASMCRIKPTKAPCYCGGPYASAAAGGGRCTNLDSVHSFDAASLTGPRQPVMAGVAERQALRPSATAEPEGAAARRDLERQSAVGGAACVAKRRVLLRASAAAPEVFPGGEIEHEGRVAPGMRGHRGGRREATVRFQSPRAA